MTFALPLHLMEVLAVCVVVGLGCPFLLVCVGSSRGLQNLADVRRQECVRKAANSRRMQSALVGAWYVFGGMASPAVVWFVQAVPG